MGNTYVTSTERQRPFVEGNCSSSIKPQSRLYLYVGVIHSLKARRLKLCMQTLFIIISVIDDVKLASMASEAVISNEPTSVQIKGMIG